MKVTIASVLFIFFFVGVVHPQSSLNVHMRNNVNDINSDSVCTRSNNVSKMKKIEYNYENEETIGSSSICTNYEYEDGLVTRWFRTIRDHHHECRYFYDKRGRVIKEVSYGESDTVYNYYNYYKETFKYKKVLIKENKESAIYDKLEFLYDSLDNLCEVVASKVKEDSVYDKKTILNVINKYDTTAKKLLSSKFNYDYILSSDHEWIYDANKKHYILYAGRTLSGKTTSYFMSSDYKVPLMELDYDGDTVKGALSGAIIFEYDLEKRNICNNTFLLKRKITHSLGNKFYHHAVHEFFYNDKGLLIREVSLSIVRYGKEKRIIEYKYKL